MQLLTCTIIWLRYSLFFIPFDVNERLCIQLKIESNDNKMLPSQRQHHTLTHFSCIAMNRMYATLPLPDCFFYFISIVQTFKYFTVHTCVLLARSFLSGSLSCVVFTVLCVPHRDAHGKRNYKNHWLCVRACVCLCSYIYLCSSQWSLKRRVANKYTLHSVGLFWFVSVSHCVEAYQEWFHCAHAHSYARIYRILENRDSCEV